MENIVRQALDAAPDSAPPGRWTPMIYTAEERGAAAGQIAISIRLGAHMLTAEERAMLAVELLAHHSTDHPHDEHGERR